MIIAYLPKRGTDDWGSGDFGASRGTRVHNGIDLVVDPDTKLVVHVSGRVTKHGYPYASDLKYRYIEITDNNELRHRFFYVVPLLSVHTEVEQGDLIGMSQDIAGKYSTPKKVMKNHIHYEIKTFSGAFIDPEEYLVCGA